MIKIVTFSLLFSLITFSLVRCSIPHCLPKDENPTPLPVSPEIVNWKSNNTSITSILIGDFFTDDVTGYVCGYGGAIYKTTDGFANGIALNSGTTQNLGGIYFTSPNIGYTVGGGGTILKTINAGNTWIPMTVPTTANLSEVFFLNADTGYVTGSTGTLLKTINAGVTWTVLNSGVSSDLHGIYFLDANVGFASGQYYTMIKTINGGVTWTLVNTGLSGGTSVTPLTSIKFTNDSIGYAVGGYLYTTGIHSNGIIIKTTDGGTTWVQQAHPAGTDFLNTIKFFNSNIGYIVGGDIANNTSTILKTANGGNTWIIQPTSNFRLVGLFLTNTGIGYAVGHNGAIVEGTL